VNAQVERFEPVQLGLKQIAEATGQSLQVIHSAIAAGHLKTFLVGRRRYARPEAVRAWVDYLEAQSDAGTPVFYGGRGPVAAARATPATDG
jgi:hypothetical protein